MCIRDRHHDALGALFAGEEMEVEQYHLALEVGETAYLSLVCLLYTSLRTGYDDALIPRIVAFLPEVAGEDKVFHKATAKHFWQEGNDPWNE